MSKKVTREKFTTKATRCASTVAFGFLLGQVVIYSGVQDSLIERVKNAVLGASPVQMAQAAELPPLPEMPQSVVAGVTAAARETPMSERRTIPAPVTRGTVPHTLHDPVEKAMRHA